MIVTEVRQAQSTGRLGVTSAKPFRFQQVSLLSCALIVIGVIPTGAFACLDLLSAAGTSLPHFSRVGETVTRKSHKLETGGSIPSPAIFDLNQHREMETGRISPYEEDAVTTDSGSSEPSLTEEEETECLRFAFERLDAKMAKEPLYKRTCDIVGVLDNTSHPTVQPFTIRHYGPWRAHAASPIYRKAE